MSNLYIISTPYQLLIAIVKTILAHRIGKDDLVVWSYEKSFNPQIMSNAGKIFHTITIVKCSTTMSYLHILLWRNRLTRLFPRHFKILKKFIGVDEETFRDKEIYIFMDHCSLGCLLNISKIKYNLIEDGLNFYQYNLDTFKKTRCFLSPLWDHLLGTSWKCFGESPYTKTIEVNTKEKILVKHDHIIVKNRKEMFKELKLEEINYIANIFCYKPQHINIIPGATLLLTQPLSEDGLISHSKKIALYKHLKKKYAIGTLYIKAHPREREDYSKVFPDAIIFEASKIPFEIYQLKEKFHFKRAVTAYSTAIDAIFCADEKITFGKEASLNF